MGTNYYWKDEFVEDKFKDYEKDSIQKHIGKRSAAGTYCYDCGTTFNTLGTDTVHDSNDNDWIGECPSCGKSFEDKNISPGLTSLVELGFNETSDIDISGVSTCSSFTWTLMKHKKRITSLWGSPVKCIYDEYDDEFTASEFLDDELRNVTIEAQVPREFS